VGEWFLSAREVDADADARRFVEDEFAEESPARIGTCFGVWAVSTVCGSRVTMLEEEGGGAIEAS